VIVVPPHLTKAEIARVAEVLAAVHWIPNRIEYVLAHFQLGATGLIKLGFAREPISLSLTGPIPAFVLCSLPH
jgi:hypothetical protein